MNKIVILSTQRSGSTMVCDDLSGTHKLGTPSEYFIKVIQQTDSSKEELEKLLNTQLVKGCTENKVCSVKVMSNQIKPIGKALAKVYALNKEFDECFYDFIKDATILRIYRKDKVAQAVSRVMARITKIYHSADSIKGVESLVGGVASKENRKEDNLPYDAALIKEEIKKIKQEEDYLDEFIKRFKIKLIETDYESAVVDRDYVFEVAKNLNVENIQLKDRRLKKVSGSVSQQWIDRYKAENQEP